MSMEKEEKEERKWKVNQQVSERERNNWQEEQRIGAFNHCTPKQGITLGEQWTAGTTGQNER